MQLLKRFFNKKSVSSPGLKGDTSGEFASFEDAMRADAASVYGYESKAVLDHYIWCYQALDKMSGTEHAFSDRFRRLIPVMAAMNLARPIERVVDFGGSHGEYYQRLRYLDPSFDPIWDIVETPAVCSIASQLGLSTKKRFFSNLQSLPSGPVSFVIASGVIQFIHDPIKIIEEIFSLQASYVLFSRLPVVPFLKKDVVHLLRASTMEATYPVWSFSPSIFAVIKIYGEIVFDFTIPEDMVSFQDATVPFSGVLVRTHSSR